jgi:hypothetical protein
LKATQETSAQTPRVAGFKLDFTNVTSTHINSQLTVFTSETVEKAKIKTTSDSPVDLQKTGFNTFSLANLPQGVYTLDVILDGGNIKGAHEGILVIGQASQEIIQKEITKTVTDIDVRITFERPKPKDKNIVCLYNPAHPLCKPGNTGKCPPGWGKNEDEQCFPMNKKCPPGYWRADDDETGACVPRGEEVSQDEEDLP